MKTPILGGYAVARSTNAADNRLMNLYPEATPEGGKTSGFLTRCPGIKSLITVGSGPIRGLWQFGGYMYVVSGIELYKVDTSWTATLLGTVSGAGPVSMSDNGDQLFIACNPRGYTYSAVSNTFAEITDPDFPGAVTVGFINGYFVFNEPTSQKLWITSYQDGSSVDPLEFAYADANPDNLLSLVVNRNEVWLFGSTSTEVWYYSGDVDFPLARIQGAFNEVGCAAPYSVAKLDNTMYWLGSDPRGNAMVYKAVGYGAERVSTHGIEKVMQSYNYVGDAIGYSYQQEGHTFYVLTFPSANATWCYDTATQEWHQRGSWSQGQYFRHRSNCQVNFNNKIIVGDYQFANLFEFALDYYKDDIGTQRWLRSWRALPPNQNPMTRTAHHNLQLDVETGTNTATTTTNITQYQLVQDSSALGTTTMNRLAPMFWTVNFNSEMMASLVTTGTTGLTCTCLFRTAGDLAGIEFLSQDSINGGSYRYPTNKSYSSLTLSFNYAISGNAVPLNDVNGAVLTIEGRNALGVPTTWYVRLWNYATGTGTNALITLNFNTIQGGFTPSIPIYPNDIDRMFISVIPIGYTGVTTPITETTATISITNMTVNQTMAVNNSLTPSTNVRMSNGYDNCYNQTPASVIRQIQQCGCSGLVDWYIGASHYYSVSWNGSSFVVDPAKQKLNQATAAWHTDFFARLKAANLTPIIAMSLEILSTNMPSDWVQRTYTGAASATGYVPIPTALISPCNTTGIQHMIDTYNYTLGLMPAGMTKFIQFGEWWWWCNGVVPCYYDSATTTRYTAETGLTAPIITSINNDWASATAFVLWCQAQLGKATNTVKAAVLAQNPGTQTSALIFPPQFHNIPGAYEIDGKTVLEVTNLPVDYWKYPNLDWCEVEDYDWVTANNTTDMQYTVELAFSTLGYPAAKIHYYAGFAVDSSMWPSIQYALNMWAKFQVNELFLWSQYQINRDNIKIYSSPTVAYATVVTEAVPKVLLRWSDDGGHTWSNYHERELGASGEYWTRVIWRRLGMTNKLRDRIYEISGTDQVKITVTGAELILSGASS